MAGVSPATGATGARLGPSARPFGDGKLALTAVARKIAVLLNTIAKYPDFKPAQDPKDIAKANRAKRGRGRPRTTA